MLRTCIYGVAGLAALAAAGCLQTGAERNPFLTLTETLGISTVTDPDEDTGGGGTPIGAEERFRRPMSVTFANNAAAGELNVSFVAWVETGSIRSAEQQDALLRGGYVQLTREVRIGSVFSLPPGTFVFNGAGAAGATAVRVPAAGAAAATREFSLITPDVLLAFSQPPTSCDSVAFFFTVNGEPLSSTDVNQGLFGGATGVGGLKTLAQVDAYQCEPLRPGLFIKLGGGAKRPNEYFEGASVRFDFFGVPNAEGFAATVTIADE